MKIEKGNYYRCKNSDKPEFEVGLIYRSHRDGCLTANGKAFALFGTVENSFEKVPNPVVGQIGKLKEQHRNKTDELEISINGGPYVPYDGDMTSMSLDGVSYSVRRKDFKPLDTPEINPKTEFPGATPDFIEHMDNIKKNQANKQGCDESKHGIFHESDDEDYPLIRCYAHGNLMWETDRHGKINVQWKPGGDSDYGPQPGDKIKPKETTGDICKGIVDGDTTLLEWLKKMSHITQTEDNRVIYRPNHWFIGGVGKNRLICVEKREEEKSSLREKQFSRKEVLALLTNARTCGFPTDAPVEHLLDHLLQNIKF